MGYVYIASNPDFKEEYKIGQSIHPEDRMKSLHTGTPREFKIIILLQSENYKEIEKMLHNKYASYRVKERKEFFQLAVTQLKEIIHEFSEYIVTCDLTELPHNSIPQESKDIWQLIKGIFENKGRPKLPERYILSQLRNNGVTQSEGKMYLHMYDDDGKMVYDPFECTWMMKQEGVVRTSTREINNLLGFSLYLDDAIKNWK